LFEPESVEPTLDEFTFVEFAFALTIAEFVFVRLAPLFVFGGSQADARQATSDDKDKVKTAFLFNNFIISSVSSEMISRLPQNRVSEIE